MAGSIISRAYDCKPVATKGTPPEFPLYLHGSQSVILKGSEFYVGQELLACQGSQFPKTVTSPGTMTIFFEKKLRGNLPLSPHCVYGYEYFHYFVSAQKNCLVGYILTVCDLEIFIPCFLCYCLFFSLLSITFLS